MNPERDINAYTRANSFDLVRGSVDCVRVQGKRGRRGFKEVCRRTFTLASKQEFVSDGLKNTWSINGKAIENKLCDCKIILI